MPALRTLLLLLCISLFLSTAAFAKNACISCEQVKELRLADVRILETNEMTEGSPHCKVRGVIGKEINFEILLPAEWNGRYVMGGGGGFVGTIQNMASFSVQQGYATSGTDTGHQANGLKADWALHNMERQLNFGHLAVHRTAEVSKVLIYHYYCAEAEYSYFMGCSRGGGQAMMEAQRYPDDFDGIIAMAPAFDWPAIAAEFIQNTRAIYPKPDKLDQPVITANNLKLLEEMVLNQCDETDGVKDGILNDPRKCKVDWNRLPKCAGDKASASCFTSTQLAAIRTVYKGVDHQGKSFYPGFPPGNENEEGGWKPWITGSLPETLAELNFPSLQFGFGTEIFKYLIFQNPEWDYTKYDFSNLHADTRYAAAYLNANSTDYSAFKDQGGKLIFTHGWSDPALSALATIQHYEAMEKRDPTLRSFSRLYLLPGVLHCGDGPGPSQADWLQLIVNWVEKGEAPNRVEVTKFDQAGKAVMSRPVFPYPKVASYDGKGDPNQAGSFH